MVFEKVQKSSLTDRVTEKIYDKIVGGEIARAAGKKVLSAVFENDVDVDKFCEENNLNAKIDDSFILDTVRRVIGENDKAVADYKSGKVKAMQSIFGCIMKELKGNGDPAVIRALLEKELNS